jgi:predicted glycoside hydrolase/deacetylase ChbG (UPF0249 family)
MEAPSLAERLGYRRDQRVVIVNCDDLGSSHAANTAIYRAMDRGIATSATLMVPCPWAREAARMFAGRDLGVHLTLTCEYPGYRWRSLTAAASLHDDDGFMPATIAEVWARANLDEARAECRAQIEQALAWGVDVTHLDSHMGTVQLDGRFFDIYLDLAEEYRLPLRMSGRGADAQLGFEGRRRAAERGVLYTDYFLNIWPNDTREVFFERIPSLFTGVTEVFAHPVDDGPELRGYDPDHPDIRANDAICFSDPAVLQLMDNASVTRISYRPLRDLQRSGRAV